MHLEGYSPKDTFNADEAGILFNLLPQMTLSVKEACHRRRNCKERVVALLCSNSEGSEKFPPLVVGKFAKLRRFKNVKALPCH
jgi:hypothetical protein